jgi:hypothetical protein
MPRQAANHANTVRRARSDQPTSGRGTKSMASGSALFRCVHCGGALAEISADRMQCMRCQESVSVVDGIKDFVGGASRTELDNIDYDQFYGIDEAHSSSLFQGVKRVAGNLWSDDFGHALEIGCGTGGFSLALFQNISPRHVVLTDVSIKMLTHQSEI